MSSEKSSRWVSDGLIERDGQMVGEETAGVGGLMGGDLTDLSQITDMGSDLKTTLAAFQAFSKDGISTGIGDYLRLQTATAGTGFALPANDDSYTATWIEKMLAVTAARMARGDESVYKDLARAQALIDSGYVGMVPPAMVNVPAGFTAPPTDDGYIDVQKMTDEPIEGRMVKAIKEIGAVMPGGMHPSPMQIANAMIVAAKNPDVGAHDGFVIINNKNNEVDLARDATAAAGLPKVSAKTIGRHMDFAKERAVVVGEAYGKVEYPLSLAAVHHIAGELQKADERHVAKTAAPIGGKLRGGGVDALRSPYQQTSQSTVDVGDALGEIAASLARGDTIGLPAQIDSVVQRIAHLFNRGYATAGDVSRKFGPNAMAARASNAFGSFAKGKTATPKPVTGQAPSMLVSWGNPGSEDGGVVFKPFADHLAKYYPHEAAEIAARINEHASNDLKAWGFSGDLSESTGSYRVVPYYVDGSTTANAAEIVVGDEMDGDDHQHHDSNGRRFHGAAHKGRRFHGSHIGGSRKGMRKCKCNRNATVADVDMIGYMIVPTRNAQKVTYNGGTLPQGSRLVTGGMLLVTGSKPDGTPVFDTMLTTTTTPGVPTAGALKGETTSCTMLGSGETASMIGTHMWESASKGSGSGGAAVLIYDN